MSCLVDGNLMFNIIMIKGIDIICINESYWFNYSVKLVCCVDIDIYLCIGVFDGFNNIK